MRTETKEKRVLVVDDDPLIRGVFRKFAQQYPELMSLKTAANSYEAGSYMMNFEPQIVFLDIALNNMDGRKICKITRDHKKISDLKIIAISGAIRDEGELKGCGFDYFLKKPFDMETVKAIILD